MYQRLFCLFVGYSLVDKGLRYDQVNVANGGISGQTKRMNCIIKEWTMQYTHFEPQTLLAFPMTERH